MKRINILGLPADTVTYQQSIDKVAQCVGEKRPFWIMAVNPEKVMKSRSSAELRQLLLQADMFIPDGMGVLWYGRIMGTPFPERVTGADLFVMLIAEAAKRGWKVFLLGAAPGIAEQVAGIWREKYPDLKIVGVLDGYYSPEEESNVVQEINAASPDLLFVAMGSPRQEKFITKYRSQLSVSVCMGVGGSFDVVCGKVKRAPVWMQKCGLEWTYRFLREPKRILRILVLPHFAMLVFGKKWGLFKTEEEVE